jgi:mannitol-1-phosphate 5-dehydrogenase
VSGSLTYVGFGFGAIQAGLFLHEALRSGNYRRLAVAEVVPGTVDALRKNGGRFVVNIAHADRVEQAAGGPVEIGNPDVEADREALIRAVAEAESMGTAVPSVANYVSPGPGSIHRLLAEGLRRKAATGGPRAVVYAAENHNHAAEILEERVRGEIPAAERDAALSRVRFLNTVIGKMSGILPDAASFRARGLEPVTPGGPRAFLVEAFNRILITRIRFDGPPFERGIRVFEEKEDLLPFEEAKLYGHNATHALGAYVGAVRGAEMISDLRDLPGILPFMRAAFLEESGRALCRKHAGLDPLFTPEGYARYADDLLDRMTNPHLHDRADRVGRDPHRKLGWDDRLVGTMRTALGQGVTPRRYAIGAAAAAAVLDRARWESEQPLADVLGPLWAGAAGQDELINLIEEGRSILKRWRTAGFPDLERFARSG